MSVVDYMSIIIIMIYYELIDALSAVRIEINLKTLLCIHVDVHKT